MSGQPKTQAFTTMRRLVSRLRDELNGNEKHEGKDFVLLYAFNGTGKTRLSMAFKDAGKKGDARDTLYFNAFTEDLFFWDNDLTGDNDRVLRLNSASRFLSGFKELALEERINNYLQRYVNFDFDIDYDNWAVRFSCTHNGKTITNIKVSRGEETMFVWCVFLAVLQLVMEGDEAYKWVRFVYIDDPISSLDDNNVIVVASDLAKLLKEGAGRVKTVLSSHHALFFNVMCNEIGSSPKKHKKYFLHKNPTTNQHSLQATSDTPFFHHVAVLHELQEATRTGRLYTYHFNMLRGVLERTATFFGFPKFSACIGGVDDEVLYARALNLLSHGKYSVYEPREMVQENKDLFKRILEAFLVRYPFQLSEPEQGSPGEQA